MMLGGIQRLTLVDYPGKVAATVFTVGCNFLCSFCHNPELVEPSLIKSQPIILEDDFLKFLETRKGELDGVCVTGGEPTLHKDLPVFLSKIKSLGFAVKLDTNGSHPQRLQKLIDDKLVDYIAMDIKAPFAKYEEISGVADLGKIKESIGLIKKFLEHEFRTTIVPKFHSKEDIVKIAEEISSAGSGLPAKRYFLQQFYPTKTLDVSLKDEKAYPPEKLREFCEEVKMYFGECKVRE